MAVRVPVRSHVERPMSCVPTRPGCGMSRSCRTTPTPLISAHPPTSTWSSASPASRPFRQLKMSWARAPCRSVPSCAVRRGPTEAGTPLVVVIGADDAGVLHGSYALLEALGVRFYLSGSSVPRQGPVTLPDVELDGAPVVRLRGFMPYTDFLTGPSVWNEEDYVAVIDSAARLRLNLFSMHFYTFEPVGDFTFKGVGVPRRSGTPPGRHDGISAPGSCPTSWPDRTCSPTSACRRHLRGAFGDGGHFERPRSKLAENDIRAAFEHAAQRGMQTAIGVEVTDPPLEFRALVDPAVVSATTNSGSALVRTTLVNSCAPGWRLW